MSKIFLVQTFGKKNLMIQHPVIKFIRLFHHQIFVLQGTWLFYKSMSVCSNSVEKFFTGFVFTKSAGKTARLIIPYIVPIVIPAQLPQSPQIITTLIITITFDGA